MRYITHDGLSSGSLQVIDVVAWSKNKLLTYPKRIESDTEDFIIAGKTYLTRVLLETKRRSFGNAKEINFSKIGGKCDVSLSD